MKISIDEIKALAKLSSLTFSDAELETMSKDFSNIASFVDQIKSVNIDDDTQIQKEISIAELREDVVEQSMDINQILLNAPKKDSSTFIVPKVVD